MKEYGVNISQFTRAAIDEKLKRDWPSIKEKKEKIEMPF
jgi:post-segregation antitoxin (ccd killing protein)